jgi:AraC family transcriptional regulator
MIFHQFPDLTWLKAQAETNFTNRQAWQGRSLPTSGWPSVVMNVKAGQTFRDNIRGPLSLFANLQGESRIHIKDKVAKVDNNYFFVSNRDQHYTLEISEKNATETINIHFGDYWADEVLQTLKASPETSLDQSLFTAPLERFELHNKLYEISPALKILLSDLKQSEGDSLLEEQKLVEVLTLLLLESRQLKRIEARLPSVKNSTRKEIFKRLADATDYIYANPQQAHSLDSLAKLSCLSKFHFLRLFKIAFAKTPHQFVNEVKIKHASSLLTTTSMEVKAIAKRLGFKDSSTFSRLYFNQTGLYPSQIR